MQLKKKSSHSLKKNYSPKSVNPPEVYDSLTNLILSVWWRIHETGDVLLLLKDKHVKSHKLKSYCLCKWSELKEEYINKFGMSESNKEYWTKAADIAIQKIDFALTKDRTKKTFIHIAELELASITPKRDKADDWKTKSILEKALGKRINPSDTVVMEYYTDIELMQEMASYGRGN